MRPPWRATALARIAEGRVPRQALVQSDVDGAGGSRQDEIKARYGACPRLEPSLRMLEEPKLSSAVLQMAAILQRHSTNRKTQTSQIKNDRPTVCDASPPQVVRRGANAASYSVGVSRLSSPKMLHLKNTPFVTVKGNAKRNGVSVAFADEHETRSMHTAARAPGLPPPV
jgi:hypothetical protein